MENILTEVTVSLQQKECSSYLTTFFNLTNLNNFYINNIVLSRKDIIKLCCDTMEQSKCNKWFETRNLRFQLVETSMKLKVE